MKKWILSILVLLSLLTLTGCEDEENKGAVSGIVTNANGDFIVAANVNIVYTDGNTTAITDTTGKYSASELPSSGDVTVTVSKDGYLDEVQTAQLGETEVVLDFVLSLDLVVPTTSSVSGVIKNVSGEPLEGVSVHSSLENTLTTANGSYTVAATVGEKVSITADLINYAQNSRNVTVLANETASLDMTMVVVDRVVSFSVTDGATISTKGATVEFGASSIVNADGSAFSGDVTAKVSFNQVTSSVGREAFPGDYIGLQTNGEETVLQSYGFIDVTLEDESGNELRLADGATAILTYPMDASIEATPPTIPLWYYDTVTGTWVEDGVASYDAGTNTYTGTVSHFTTWNLDAKVPRAEIQGCVSDENGLAVTNAVIYLSTEGWNRSFPLTDANGDFNFVNAPSGLEMTLSAQVNGIISPAEVFTLKAGEIKTFNECLGFDSSQLADPDAVEKFTKVTGRLLYSDGSPITDTRVYILSDGQDIPAVYTDANGIFTSTTFTKPSDSKITVQFDTEIANANIHYEKTFAVDSSNVLTNVGTIEVRVTKVKLCVENDDGSAFGDIGTEVSIDSPLNSTNYYFPDSGIVEGDIILAQDNQVHTAYAHLHSLFTDQHTRTGSTTFLANADTVDLLDACIQLHPIDDYIIKAAISFTTTIPERSLSVVYVAHDDLDSPSRYGDENILENVQSGSFNMTKDGVYLVIQEIDSFNQPDMDGTMSVTVNSQTYTLTIPANSETYSAWIGFAIKVDGGVPSVITINKESNPDNEG